MKSPPDAKSLQEMVLFYIIYYGGRRGRENLRHMTEDSFRVDEDSDGRKYIHQVKKELTKNHTAKDFDKINEARIYEQKGNFTIK